MGRKILLKCYGDVCLKYRLKVHWLLSCRSRFCFQKGVAANEFTTQLADSTKFVKVGTVRLSSFRSPKEHNVWNFPTVSTMNQPCCSDAQGIFIRTWFLDSFLSWRQNFGVITVLWQTWKYVLHKQTLYSKFWYWTVSKYKVFKIQSKINNSHYHPNTHHNILLP